MFPGIIFPGASPFGGGSPSYSPPTGSVSGEIGSAIDELAVFEVALSDGVMAAHMSAMMVGYLEYQSNQTVLCWLDGDLVYW